MYKDIIVENKHSRSASLSIVGLFDRLDLTEIRRPSRINANEYNTKQNKAFARYNLRIAKLRRSLEGTSDFFVEIITSF